MTTPTLYLQGMPRILASIGLSIATFIIVLDYSIANVSIPYIAGDLAIGTDQGIYVITSFAVGNSILLPITGWLTKRVGAVRLLLLSLFFFVLLSFFCGASFSIEMLVLGRFLQGMSAGPLIPLSQTLILRINPLEKRTGALSLWSAIVITAPVLGPILGGWITYNYVWPWIFYINIPIGLLSLFICWLYLKPFETPTERRPVDWIGLCLLAIGVSALQVLLDKGQQWDWWNSPLIRALTVTSILSFVFLVVWEVTDSHPLIELKMFKVRSYALSIFFIAVAYAIYFGTIVLIPLWLQENMGYTAEWAGIAVAPLGIPPALFSFYSGRFVAKYGAIIALFFCFILFAISCFYTATMTTDVDIWHVGFGRLLLGCAFIFFILPLLNLSIQDIPSSQLPSATGVFHFVRAMVGGIGASVFTTLWQRRTIFYHERVGEHLTSNNPNFQGYLDNLGQFDLHGKAALEMTNIQLGDQAAMLAINDSFYLMGWIFIGLLFVLPLGIKRKTATT